MKRYRPQNSHMHQVINEEVYRILIEGIIEYSSSPWSTTVVLVTKNGKFRLVNAVTKKDAYPLPYFNAILDMLREAKYISSINLRQRY